MNDILAQIVENKRREVERASAKIPLSQLKAFLEDLPPSLDLAKALSEGQRKKPVIIAECKRKSPSKGTLIQDYDPVALAKKYEAGGASCISVLTDEKFFGGSLKHLAEVKQNVRLPILRKDFIVDEYQIYEARKWGADTFLLIAGLLDAAQLQYFLEIGRELGMEALMETHCEEEIELALKTDAKVIGINNRNLKTMQVDINTAFNLAKKIRISHPDKILVCESGISNKDQLVAGLAHGFSAFLIGETLVKSADPTSTLRQLLS